MTVKTLGLFGGFLAALAIVAGLSFPQNAAASDLDWLYEAEAASAGHQAAPAAYGYDGVATGWHDPAAHSSWGYNTVVRTADARRWSVAAGALFLHRSTARSATLVEDGTTDAELANVSDFDLGFATGPRFAVSRRLGCHWEIGAEYFGIDGWSASRRLASPGNLRVPMVSDDPADFFDTAGARYASRLYSTEVNLKRRFGTRIRLLGGFRWVELHELISAEAFSPGLEGAFAIRTNNYLYGGQFGAEAIFVDREKFRLDGFLKAGVFGTHIGARLDAEGTFLDWHESITHRRTSFLGEIGLTASYRLTRHLSVFGGYQVMWLEGVALAGDSVAAMQSADPDSLWSGSAFYHGAIAGAQLTW